MIKILEGKLVIGEDRGYIYYIEAVKLHNLRENKIMDKPNLEEHTIKVLNEQGEALRQGDKYITTSNQGVYGGLVFTFSKEYITFTNSTRYRLKIVLNSINGNSSKIYHKMNSDSIKLLYEYISKRIDDLEHSLALSMAHELNLEKSKITTVIK